MRSVVAALGAALFVCSAQCQSFIRYWNQINPYPALIVDTVTLPGGAFATLGERIIGDKRLVVNFHSRTGTLTFTTEILTGDIPIRAYRLLAFGANMYVIGARASGPIIASVNQSGRVNWTATPSATIINFSTPHIDGDGNVYVGGNTGNGGFIFSYSPTGNLRWGRSFTKILAGFAVSNFVHCVFYNQPNGPDYSLISSLDGSPVTSAPLGFGTGQTEIKEVFPIGPEHMAVVGNTNGSISRGFVLRVLQAGFFSKFEDLDGSQYDGGSFRNGKLWVYGSVSGDLRVAQFNANALSLDWARILDRPNATYLRATRAVADAFGEIYVLGESGNASGFSQIDFTKINAAGIVRWADTWSSAATEVYPRSVTLHPSSGDLMVAGQDRLAVYRQAPVALADVFPLKRNTTLLSPKTVTANDRQWQGATVTLVTPPAQGTFNLNANGTFTFTPPANFTGKLTFVYRLSKPSLAVSTATVTLDVRP